jgi:hypothetical protein
VGRKTELEIVKPKEQERREEMKHMKGSGGI